MYFELKNYYCTQTAKQETKMREEIAFSTIETYKSSDSKMQKHNETDYKPVSKLFSIILYKLVYERVRRYNRRTTKHTIVYS